MNKFNQLAMSARSKAARIAAFAAAGVSALATLPARAEAIDVSAVVTDISAQKAPVGEIGMAVLGVLVAIACFAYIRRAMKG